MEIITFLKLGIFYWTTVGISWLMLPFERRLSDLRLSRLQNQLVLCNNLTLLHQLWVDPRLTTPNMWSNTVVIISLSSTCKASLNRRSLLMLRCPWKVGFINLLWNFHMAHGTDPWLFLVRWARLPVHGWLAPVAVLRVHVRWVCCDGIHLAGALWPPLEGPSQNSILDWSCDFSR